MFCESCGDPVKLCVCPAAAARKAGQASSGGGASAGRGAAAPVASGCGCRQYGGGGGSRPTAPPAAAVPASQCKGCGKGVEGQVINALGGSWHPSCFVCAGCKGAFTSPGVVAHEGKPYHRACYQKKLAPKCAGCGEAILAAHIVTNSGAHYHAACLTCAGCATSLADGFYEGPNGRPHCAACMEMHSSAGAGGRERRDSSLSGGGAVATAALRLPRPTGKGNVDLAKLRAWAVAAVSASGVPKVFEDASPDWSRAWADGRAFCAVVAAYFPEHVPLDAIRSVSGLDGKGRCAAIVANCNLAFRVAAEQAAVPSLLDPEDMTKMYPAPDQKSITLYAISLWGGLSRAAAQTERHAPVALS
jgi:hypothetical protein